LVVRDEPRVIGSGEPRRHIRGGHRRIGRDREEVETVFPISSQKNGAGFPATRATAATSRWQSVSSAVPGSSSVVVTAILRRSNSRAAVIAVPLPRASTLNLPVGEVGHARDFRSREQMELFIVQPGDIADRGLDAGVVPLCVIKDVRLQEGDFDAEQKLEVGDVLERPRSDDRQDPPRRSVIDQLGEIFGDPGDGTKMAAAAMIDRFMTGRLYPARISSASARAIAAPACRRVTR